MSGTEIGGVVRTLAAFGGGFLVSRGLVDAETVTAVAGALATIAVAVWSILQKKSAAK
jgi:hypothetical protein